MEYLLIPSCPFGRMYLASKKIFIGLAGLQSLSFKNLLYTFLMDLELENCVVFNFNNRILCGKIRETGRIDDLYSKFKSTKNVVDNKNLFLAFAIPFCACSSPIKKGAPNVDSCEAEKKPLAHIVEADHAVGAFVEQIAHQRETFADRGKVYFEFLPDREKYKRAVCEAVKQIEGNALIEKIVLGRKLLLTTKHIGEIDPLRVLKNMLLRNTSRYIFSLPTETGILLGASPELLIEKRAERFYLFRLREAYLLGVSHQMMFGLIETAL